MLLGQSWRRIDLSPEERERREDRVPCQLSRVGRFGFASSRRSGLARGGGHSVAFRARELQGTFFVVRVRRSRIPCPRRASRRLSAISCSIEFSMCPPGGSRQRWTVPQCISNVRARRSVYSAPFSHLRFTSDLPSRLSPRHLSSGDPSFHSSLCDDREICMWFFDVVARRTCGKSPIVVTACVTFLKGLFRISRNYYFWLFAVTAVNNKPNGGRRPCSVQ